VDVLQSLQLALQFLGQRLVRGSGARKAGVAQYHAVLDRDFERVQRGEQARLALVREVAVPEAACILDADGLAFGIQDVGHDQNFRIALQPMLLAHVLLEHPEPTRKRNLLLRRDFLIAEDDDLVVEERFGNLIEGGVIQGTGQVDAADLGAEVAAQAPNFK
jgi:hypothetical protein